MTDPLDQIISSRGADAYVMYASSSDPDMRYLTGFISSDPFVYFKKKGERGLIIVSQMDYSRAVREAKTGVMTRTSAGLPDILKRQTNSWKATALMVSGQVKGTLLVPPAFPYALASALGKTCRIRIDEAGLASLRAKKTPAEIRMIRHVQNYTEQAIGTAVALIRRARVKKGVLFHTNQPLTSEKVRSEMHKILLDLGCGALDTIVACGKESAIPHAVGHGPLLADEPIVIDIFPYDEKTGYYSDMTRTVVKGEPAPEIREMYAAVVDAHDLAVSRIRTGAVGAEIHQAVIDLFAERGYGTGSRGFTHNLGHGIGLQVHEAPSLGPSGSKLAAGNVVTVEPGLYYPETGGVRLEDIGSVTARGFNCFTTFSRELVL
jgi:Xaa-Pro aminopeptidase